MHLASPHAPGATASPEEDALEVGRARVASLVERVQVALPVAAGRVGHVGAALQPAQLQQGCALGLVRYSRCTVTRRGQQQQARIACHGSVELEQDHAPPRLTVRRVMLCPLCPLTLVAGAARGSKVSAAEHLTSF